MKYICRGVVLLFALMMVVVCCTGGGDGGERFAPSPARTVLSKWYDRDGRRVYLDKENISRELTVTAVLEETPPRGSRLIVKVRHLHVAAFTKGKVLYSKENRRFSDVGSRYIVADASELKPGSSVTLCLQPAKSAGAQVLSAVYLSPLDDYLFSVLYENRATYLFLLALLLLLFIGLLLMPVFRFGKRPLRLLLSALFLLGCGVFLSSDAAQFCIGSSTLRFVLSRVSFVLFIPLLLSILRLCRRYIYNKLTYNYYL